MDKGLYIYVGAMDRVSATVRGRKISPVARRDSATLAEFSGGFCHPDPYKQKHASPFRP
jgi:hypothetical protein